MRLLYDHDDDAPDAHTKVRRPFHELAACHSRSKTRVNALVARRRRVNALMARRLRVNRGSAGGVGLMFRRRSRRQEPPDQKVGNKRRGEENNRAGCHRNGRRRSARENARAAVDVAVIGRAAAILVR